MKEQMSSVPFIHIGINFICKIDITAYIFVSLI